MSHAKLEDDGLIFVRHALADENFVSWFRGSRFCRLEVEGFGVSRFSILGFRGSGFWSFEV